jgi:GNAT superfamily N-acetyltransferase
MPHILYETQQDGFLISTNPARLQLETIYEFLAQSYWANDRPRMITDRSVENSLCFGVYEGEKQIGFSRVITDYATYAWLCDVFIHPDYRSRGLGKWMMANILAHPELSYIRRWSLATRDAQEFYRKYGFEESKRLYALMEKVSPYPPDELPGSE